jgi:hypothetical protein
MRWAGRAAPFAIAIGALVVIAGVLIALIARDSESAPRGDCRSQLTPEERRAIETRPASDSALSGAPGSASPTAGEDLPQPVDASGQPVAGVRLTFPFGADRTPIIRYQPIRLPEGIDPPDLQISVPFGDVTRDAGRPLPRRQVRGYVVGTDVGRVVTVAICVNPALPTEIRPGAYTGTALVGAGERATALSFEITAQDDRNERVILATVLGVLAGLVVKLFADFRDPLLPNRTLVNLISPRTLVAVGAGVVTGVYSYLTIYADDPVFLADFGSLWRVTAEAFAGTLAAKALTDLTGRAGGGRAGGDGKGQDGTSATEETETEKARDDADTAAETPGAGQTAAAGAASSSARSP